ncbi:uroporphyrinogen-III synthase [Staphylococcus hyicus]|uniref:uroporphyrinogen-III synthase n=1 Tax=Staphylococcus hyicus TaxID=1284 RepID=UPI00217CEE68|nr:uroporphyrinogen-III synthase [Staphylococcus hyicus]UWF57809.1 uroporphyrinogen-III synthase [Staphylococcus hyicus]
MKPIVLMTQTHTYEDARVRIRHLPFIKPVPLSFDERVLKSHYDWLIFTSKNAVNMFRPYLEHAHMKNIAAIGEKTKQYCDSIGLEVRFYPNDYSQEGFLKTHPIQKEDVVLMPSSIKARPLLTDTLISQGIQVTKIDLYDIQVVQTSVNCAVQAMNENQIDAITFASSSAAHAFFKTAPPKRTHFYYAIGEQTARTIQQYGHTCIKADQQTLESLITKIIEVRSKT